MHHCKPDIYVHLTNPDEIYIFEVAVSHIQNLRNQEKLKTLRYKVNSVANVERFDQQVTRDLSLVGEVLKAHGYCAVTFAVCVLECFGEVVATEEFRKFQKVMTERLRTTQRDWRHMIRKASYSVVASTSSLLMKRVTGGSTDYHNSHT